MKTRHNESLIQKQCVFWFRMQYPKLAKLLFAVGNGGKRSKIEAAIMKGEGVTAGVADLLLLFPNHKYYGLCIEMKTPTGKQQESQKEFRELSESLGYKYGLCRSIEEFQNTITMYLSHDNKLPKKL